MREHDIHVQALGPLAQSPIQSQYASTCVYDGAVVEKQLTEDLRQTNKVTDALESFLFSVSQKLFVIPLAYSNDMLCV